MGGFLFMADRRFKVFLGLLVCLGRTPWTAGAQDSLSGLMYPSPGKLLHVSSWDRSGGNGDLRSVEPGQTHTLVDLRGAGIIHRIWFTVAPEAPDLLRQAVLRFYWDGKDQPSIQVPLGDFFGAGFGLYEHYISLPLSMTSGGYNCYWQMPFRKGVRITVTNESGCRIDALYYNIDIEQVPRLAEDTLYFHAEWRRENPTQPGKNYTVLETKGQGHFVGLLMEMQDRNGGFGFLEGDERVFVDGESKPSINGTGTEDYFNSGWYFNRGTFSAPYHGLILMDEDLSRVCAYRWHILDPIPFKRSLRFTIEHGHNNEVETDYSSVAYWYQTPAKGVANLPPPEERMAYIPPPPMVLDGMIEGEGLIDNATATNGKVQTQNMRRFGDYWSGGKQLWWTENKVGDRMAMKVKIDHPGTYRIAGYLTKSKDYGIFQLWVNGAKVSEPVNSYDSKVIHSGKIDFGTVELRHGSNRFEIEIVGKDEQSIGTLVGIDGFMAERMER
jgi:hypothetical protein